jgi:AraC-like DNA-binding protein
MLYLPPSFVAETARDLWGDPRAEGFFSGALHRDPASVAATGRLFRALLEPSASPLEIRSELTGALAFLLRHCGERRGDPPPLAPRVRIVQDAMAYLRENLRANLTLEELAERFDDTPVAFLRRFRRTTGIPLHRFRIQCRVDRARRLIAEGMPLAEVAQETGFCDQSHLNRRFRAICGLTPGAYEAAIRSSRG